MGRKMHIGNVTIGEGFPIAIQSMCNTDTADVKATSAQILALAQAGCDIVRVAVPDMESAEAIRELKKSAPIPIVADIHFDYRLAIQAVKCGVDKIRINPGNIGSQDNIKAVAQACKAAGVPIRVGVNGGSVDRDLREQYGVTAQALCQSALRNVMALEHFGFDNICVSLKASDVFKTIESYEQFAKLRNYPLHLGVTEAGSIHMGTIKSAAAYGALLYKGIGDTIRVSLTADPVKEIYAAQDILKALSLNKSGVTVISCPTCARTKVDIVSLAQKVENQLSGVQAKLTVAVMGCAVNGPGEAAQADIGIAAGVGEGIIIKKGAVLCKLPEHQLLDALVGEIERMTGEKICKTEQS